MYYFHKVQAQIPVEHFDQLFELNEYCLLWGARICSKDFTLRNYVMLPILSEDEDSDNERSGLLAAIESGGNTTKVYDEVNYKN